MPQININEIDRSIYNFTVSDNRVKVFVPIVASFGPIVTVDSSENNIMSFTDVTDFNKVFGYTEPEFDPIENDYSRIYAQELIRRGAEVSCVRLNEGEFAEFDIGGEPTSRVVTDAAKESPDYVSGGGQDKFKFCPQIESITAKYTGSFGNSLLMTIAPINSKNVSYSNQYAMISVYFARQSVEIGDNGKPKSRTITQITKLESRRVSTNPADPDYFEDVEFDFIKITGTATARNELSAIWSNMDTTESGMSVVIYSGFPTIPLKKKDGSGYNTYAMLWGGADFKYSAETLEFLRTDFKGYYETSSDYIEKVNKFIDEEFDSSTGLTNTIYANLASCYANFADPYVYDFDFITSGGLLETKYLISKQSGKISTVTNTFIGTLSSLLTTHVAMRDLVEKRKDCIALCDVYADYSPDNLTEYVRLINSSYCTVHNPWCYINSPNESKRILMSPSFIFMHTLLSNLINNLDAQKWFPPAGVTRATARVVVKPMYEVGSVLLDKWQNTGLTHVNPIMKLKQYGYVIYGQYTAYEAQDEFTHSALESLNVRLIANTVKKKIFTTCLKLSFEPNNSKLWLKFYDEMEQFLSYMKYNDGLYAYKIVMDSSTVTTDDINALRCPGKVYIAPTRTAEFFDIDFIITGAGVTFNENESEVE